MPPERSSILKRRFAEAAGIQYIEMPIAYDTLTVAINLQYTWSRMITIAELKKYRSHRSEENNQAESN